MSKFNEEEISRKGSVCQCPPPTYQATPRHSGLGGVLRVSVSVAGSLQSPSVGVGGVHRATSRVTLRGCYRYKGRGSCPQGGRARQHPAPNLGDPSPTSVPVPPSLWGPQYLPKGWLRDRMWEK